MSNQARRLADRGGRRRSSANIGTETVIVQKADATGVLQPVLNKNGTPKTYVRRTDSKLPSTRSQRIQNGTTGGDVTKRTVKAIRWTKRQIKEEQTATRRHRAAQRAV